MTLNFEVKPYSKDNLGQLFIKVGGAKDYIIAQKSSFLYLTKYLEASNAKTLVLENEYIDKDYSKDFSTYYVECFKSYYRNCSRLHIFDIFFTRDNFEETLKNCAASTLTLELLLKHYLGFIVIKPLPNTIIGKTCLKPYQDGHRHYTVIVPYEANLFGIPLRVETLGFQEQDEVTSACSSIAIWSALQATGQRFRHEIPAPTEITKEATKRVPPSSRIFPTVEGLTMTQMAEGIRSVKMEPLMINVKEQYMLKSNLYAYLRGGIPVVLGLKLVESSAYHTVTAAGYSFEGSQHVPSTGPSLAAYRTKDIYVHDDQIGPFTPMGFDEGINLTTIKLIMDGTSMLAEVQQLLIPVYPTIRIRFSSIFYFICYFEGLTEDDDVKKILDTSHRLEWDIYLTEGKILKNELLNATNLAEDERFRVLTKSMPRFLWRATALVNNLSILDLLFDATDIEQGQFFFSAVSYDLYYTELIRVSARKCLNSNIGLTPDARKFCDWYVNGS